jgi:uncharacterized protein
MSRSLTTVFADTTLTLDAAGVVYGPQERTLIISDMHFGKGSFLGSEQHLLPHYDIVDTIERARALIAHYQPDKVVSLGDSFHDKSAHQRMEDSTVAAINQLCSMVRSWIWVLGNHDPSIAACFAGITAQHHELGNMLLTHEPMDAQSPQIIGHFHPKTRIKLLRSRLSGKCFVQNNQYLLMPSFGSYTGGLDASHEAITHYIPEAQQRKFFMYNNKIWSV